MPSAHATRSATTLPRDLADFQRERHVLGNRHMRPDRVGLEHHADVADVGRRHDAAAGRRDRLARDSDLAAVGVLEAGNAPQGRRLAATRGAEQRHELALRDLERDVRDDLVGAVDLDQAFDRDAHGV